MSNDKVIDLDKKDSRGLPLSLDPRYFYEYSTLGRQHVATGIEGLLYRLIPYTFIRSLAFAIDPLSRFKVAPARITPANRTRVRTSDSVLGIRSYSGNYSNTQFYEWPIFGPTNSSGTYGGSLPPQLPLSDLSIDSSKRLRLVGSEYNEFSMWKADVRSPSRAVRQLQISDVQWPDTKGPYWYRTRFRKAYWNIGPAAIISPTVVDALRISEWAHARAVMASHVLSLYKSTTAQRQATTLFRNVVELRDLPRGILQLKETLMHLRSLALSLDIPKTVLERIHSFKTTGFDIPKEYLSYSFGWRQTYSDISDLLLSPNRISKRINFLMRRNGKATTYRHSRIIEDGGTTASGFVYNTYPIETVLPQSNSITRKHELKMVINTTFEFPDVDTPTFRLKEFKRELGVVPTPTDLYNLVPWTWLLDWFTGFGNYVEIIDKINQDRELINWGFLTCKTDGELVTTYSSYVPNTRTFGWGGYAQTTTTKSSQSHRSTLAFRSHLRSDVSHILDVNTTSDKSTLSAWQLSILGSILAGRSKFIF